MDMGLIGISACLMGTECRYNSSSAFHNELFNLVKDKNVLLFCPEVLGELPTPRMPAEIVNGDGKKVVSGHTFVMDKNGIDVSQAFIKGAARTVNILMDNNVSVVVLKERSPSCGVHEIYDGNFSGSLVKGCGVLTALLQNKEMVLFSDMTINAFKKWLEQEGEEY